jgi:hypothetical protein
MRVFVKENTLWKPLCVSNTSFVNTDEFMKEMHRFVLANGTVNNVYIEFENTKVPVSHVNEIRVVAQLASAYHNTVLESALKGEKDLYGNSYTPNVWPEPQLVRPDCDRCPGGKKSQNEIFSVKQTEKGEREGRVLG